MIFILFFLLSSCHSLFAPQEEATEVQNLFNLTYPINQYLKQQNVVQLEHLAYAALIFYNSEHFTTALAQKIINFNREKQVKELAGKDEQERIPHLFLTQRKSFVLALSIQLAILRAGITEKLYHQLWQACMRAMPILEANAKINIDTYPYPAEHYLDQEMLSIIKGINLYIQKESDQQKINDLLESIFLKSTINIQEAISKCTSCACTEFLIIKKLIPNKIGSEIKNMVKALDKLEDTQANNGSDLLIGLSTCLDFSNITHEKFQRDQQRHKTQKRVDTLKPIERINPLKLPEEIAYHGHLEIASIIIHQAKSIEKIQNNFRENLHPDNNKSIKKMMFTCLVEYLASNSSLCTLDPNRQARIYKHFNDYFVSIYFLTNLLADIWNPEKLISATHQSSRYKGFCYSKNRIKAEVELKKNSSISTLDLVNIVPERNFNELLAEFKHSLPKLN